MANTQACVLNNKGNKYSPMQNGKNTSMCVRQIGVERRGWLWLFVTQTQAAGGRKSVKG